MTDRLRDEQLDHDIRSFLAWRAEDIAGAPTATEVAMGIEERSRTRTVVPRISAQLAWLLIAGLLAVALIGAAVVGANLLRDGALVVVDPTASVAPTASASYEAVFLRTGPVQGGSADVVVVAVDFRGNERQILTLPAHRPAGAVTPTGLLAVPRIDRGADRWEIVDLHRPDAAPIVVDLPALLRPQIVYEDDVRPIALWGPGERVAIPYQRVLDRAEYLEVRTYVGFVDGRTGEVTSAPVWVPANLRPYWSSDGAGVLFEGSRALRPDGSLAHGIPGVTDDGHSRRYSSDGALVDPVSVAGFEIDEVAWTADGGGTWLLMRSLTDSQSVRVQRTAPSSASQAPLTLSDPAQRDVSGLGAQFAGIAPEDSMITIIFGQRLSADNDTDTIVHFFSNGETNREATLLVPGTGAWFDIEGSFAGWLEVRP